MHEHLCARTSDKSKHRQPYHCLDTPKYYILTRMGGAALGASVALLKQGNPNFSYNINNNNNNL